MNYLNVALFIKFSVWHINRKHCIEIDGNNLVLQMVPALSNLSQYQVFIIAFIGTILILSLSNKDTVLYLTVRFQ